MMKRVLIVDDEADHRLILRTRLEACGYICEEAEDGTVALDRLAMAPMDLVLTDIKMPKMPGLQLIDSIRKFPLFHDMPVIVMTSQSMEDMSIQTRKAGAWAVMSKPYDFQKLLEEVGRATGQSEPGFHSSRV